MKRETKQDKLSKYKLSKNYPSYNDSNLCNQQSDFNDIETQLELEEELQISQEHFKSIFYQSPMATAIITIDYKFKTVNDQFCKLTGYSPEELRSLSILDIVHPEDIKINQGKVQSLLDGEINQHRTEKRYIRKDGKIVWINLSLSLVRDEEGHPINFISMIEDITERRQAQKEMEVSLEEKKILIREIHQRLNNNLQLLSKLFEIQFSDWEDEYSVKPSKTNQNRVNAIALIHEKLFQSEDFAIIDLKEYILSLITHLTKSYHVDRELIKFEVITENSILDVDSAIPACLIINELVTNSIIHAFPPKTAGKIKIILKSENEHYVLIVTDNGSGFLKEQENLNKRKNGLNLVEILVRQLKGKIESDKSQGTKFIIEFAGSKY